MGKTLEQLEWSRWVSQYTGRKVMILAPLAVAHQTVAEGKKIGLPVHYVRSQFDASGCEARVVITNYDMLKEFNADEFGGVVLDESSILKSYTGHTKRMILEVFKDTPYKLACTATPAPNDHLELGNHADFLGIMPSNEMISRWFINDTMQAGKYRLKKHAERDYWRWVTSWAICMSKPSDLGYSNDGFDLPELVINDEVVKVDHSRAWQYGQLMLTGSLSATSMWKEKSATAEDRCERALQIVCERELTKNTLSTKLSLCGNLNTQPTEETNPNLVQNIEKGEEFKADQKTLKSGNPTPGITIIKTDRSGMKALNATETNGIDVDVRNTQAIRNIGKRQKNQLGNTEEKIHGSNGRKNSGPPLESESKNTNQSLSVKVENALSVMQSLEMDGSEDYSLTTITLPEKSEDYSVPLATSDLENLEITSLSYLEPSNISKRLSEFWIIWCDTNEEQDILENLFEDYAFSIRGNDSINKKISLHERWLKGERNVLITKADIFGWGVNWQHCNQQVFVGVTYSFEKTYQALRRSWRFGQSRPVRIYIVYAESEGSILQTLLRKQTQHREMQLQMNHAMQENGLGLTKRRELEGYTPQVEMQLPEFVYSHRRDS